MGPKLLTREWFCLLSVVI